MWLLVTRFHSRVGFLILILVSLLVYIILNIYITKHLRRGPNSRRSTHNIVLNRVPEIKKNSLIGTRLQACVHPNLPLWSKEIANYFKTVEPVNCNAETDWVYTKHGKFYISNKAVTKHGKITCAYAPIVYSNDSFLTLKPIEPMLNGSRLVSDAFQVLCKSADGNKYTNMHACVAPTTRRLQTEQPETNNMYNVMIFGLDSLSRQMFIRLLPKTHRYFTDVLGGSLLEGYNIVGDGTTQALLPLLTGYRETELPEARRGKSRAKHIDELTEFVWTKYERRGYVTQWSEDMANYGTFNYRLLGFKDQPVNHYMRPFYLAASKIYPHFSRHCLGSRTRHQVFIDWLKEGIETHNGTPIFSFGFFAEYTHDNNNLAVLADDENVEYLKYLHDNGILNNTFLFVMSDHGARYGSIRMTEQGKLEERMPYFGLHVPNKFKTVSPEKYQLFLENRNRLVVPSDIHETLLEIIGETRTRVGFNRSTYSLFSKIPAERTCTDAGIEPHWCACLKSKPVSVSDSLVQRSVHTIVSLINTILEEYLEFCYVLSSSKIIKAISFVTNDEVLKFKQSSDFDGRVADLSDTLQAKLVHYQITFETMPGNGVFEASVFIDVRTGNISVNEKEISRLNRYNDAPKCIQDAHPELRPYCYCRR